MATPIRATASLAKRHGRALAPAIRAYKTDKQHAHDEGKKPSAELAEKNKKREESSAVAAAAPSAGSRALQHQQPSRMMMMSPLLSSGLFPPSAMAMLRRNMDAMDAMLQSDPFFSRGGVSALFDDPFFSGRPRAAPLAEAAAAAAEPALLPLDVSLASDGSAYLIKADLPGVDKSDVKVEVSPDGQFLTIRGERSEERSNGGGEGDAAQAAAAPRPLRVERRWASWSRSLALSPDVDADAVKASLKDGVLEVRLPKLPPPSEEEQAPPAPKTVAVE